MTENIITKKQQSVQPEFDKEFVEQYQVAKKLDLDPVKILGDAIQECENEIRKEFWNSASEEENYELLSKVARLRRQGVDVEGVLSEIERLKEQGIDVKGELEKFLTEKTE